MLSPWNMPPTEDAVYRKYAVTWTNHNQWGTVGISETYNEEFFASDIDENDYVTLLTRTQ